MDMLQTVSRSSIDIARTVAPVFDHVAFGAIGADFGNESQNHVLAVTLTKAASA